MAHPLVDVACDATVIHSGSPIASATARAESIARPWFQARQNAASPRAAPLTHRGGSGGDRYVAGG